MRETGIDTEAASEYISGVELEVIVLITGEGNLPAVPSTAGYNDVDPECRDEVGQVHSARHRLSRTCYGLDPSTSTRSH